MSYGGVLEPLLRSVERTAPSGSARLSGQRVVTPRKDLSVFVAVDGDANVHFLLAPAPDNPQRFERFNLKALTIGCREWSVAGAPTMQYLDLTCNGGTQPAYRRPFLAFCEDLLIDVEKPGVTPSDAAFRTCVRWQRFWEADDETSLAVEWVRGLLGELLFLERLIARLGPAAVGTWAGPSAQDHDFQAMSRVAFEVKVASTVPYIIECNLNQLDHTLFESLYLVCYQATRSDTGEILPNVVGRIEALLSDSEKMLDRFYGGLHSAGYRRHRRAEYDSFLFAVDGPHYYDVIDVPRITVASFDPPLDGRIRGVRYSIEIVGVEPLPEDSEAIEKALSRLLP